MKKDIHSLATHYKLQIVQIRSQQNQLFNQLPFSSTISLLVWWKTTE